MRKLFLTFSALIGLIVALPARATEPAPLTGGSVTHLSGSVSTAVETALPEQGARKFLRIVNNTAPASGNVLAVTTDGTTPAINGNGITLYPGGSETDDIFVPTGAVKIIGSAASTKYTITFKQ